MLHWFIEGYKWNFLLSFDSEWNVYNHIMKISSFPSATPGEKLCDNKESFSIIRWVFCLSLSIGISNDFFYHSHISAYQLNCLDRWNVLKKKKCMNLFYYNILIITISVEDSLSGWKKKARLKSILQIAYDSVWSIECCRINEMDSAFSWFKVNNFECVRNGNLIAVETESAKHWFWSTHRIFA